jgi:glycosyltransferase involved in cell wall biosynthesis
MSEPLLSVVIPVMDQSLPLRLTLHWLARWEAEHPLLLEIVVVDDGSAEPIAPIVGEFEDRLRLQLIRQANAGRAQARNAGWLAATGRRILFNDADRLPAESDLWAHVVGRGVVVGKYLEFYFSRLDSVAEELRSGFGRLEAKAREPLYPKLVCQYLFDAQGRCRSNLPWAAFLSGNASADRGDLERVGGYDANFREWGVEHFELGYRLWREGCQFTFAPQAANYHLAHPRDAGFYQTHMRRSMEYFRRKHADPTLDMFEQFLFGEASLQDVETASGAPGAWTQTAPLPLFFHGLRSETISRHSRLPEMRD